MIRGSNFQQSDAPGVPPAGPGDNQPPWVGGAPTKPQPPTYQIPQGDQQVQDLDIGGGA